MTHQGILFSHDVPGRILAGITEFSVNRGVAAGTNLLLCWVNMIFICDSSAVCNPLYREHSQVARELSSLPGPGSQNGAACSKV